MAKVRDYADLFALDGYWRKKRAEKKIYDRGRETGNDNDPGSRGNRTAAAKGKAQAGTIHFCQL
jgi:hypothetical protein